MDGARVFVIGWDGWSVASGELGTSTVKASVTLHFAFGKVAYFVSTPARSRRGFLGDQRSVV